MTINKYITGLVVAGGMALSAGSASAITFSGIVESGPGAETSVQPDRLNIDFSWEGTPVTNFIEFTVDMAFDFNLTGYEGGLNDITGFTFDILSGPDAGTRLTQQGGFCASADAPVAGNCDLVGPDGGTNPNTFISPFTRIYEDLGAGTYRVGMLDGNTPEIGSLTFQAVDAAVPLPAGLVLFLSGLGMLGFVSRRRA